MTRLSSFFQKIGSGIKKGVKAVGRGIVTGVKAVGRVVKPVAKTVTGILQHVPGTIGTVAGTIHKGIDTVEKIASYIPDGKVKNKINDLAQKTGALTDTGQQKAINIVNKVNDVKQRVEGAVAAIPKVI